MRKYFKTIMLVLVLSIILCGCNTPTPTPPEPPIEDDFHDCFEHPSDWIDAEEFTCGEKGLQQKKCLKCGEVVDERTYTKRHEYLEEVVSEVTCTEEGVTKKTCIHCNDVKETKVYPTGHVRGRIVVTKSQTSTTVGKRDVTCSKCQQSIKTLNYVNNGYNFNGKLSVKGPDLVNKSGRKYQLYGLSTHGLQWFGRYANFDTIASIQETFGINVIRFAFYTDEGGYCDGGESKKKQMLEDLKRGVEAATALGLYVIIDWHMVGAENDADKNPLTYLEQSKEFFSYISEYYKKQNNILYEIMNEPNGSTTWADCKKYANEIIPLIRKNTDAIILVGNPHWTADLTSVMRDPLKGYENIMYTYHFYAADHKHTSQVEQAYDNGFPVFISEFGFMEASGDGALDLTSGENWKKALDDRNISHVAWNISNSKGAASIFKNGSADMTDVSDENLKEWGVYLKNWYRSKSGLDKLKDE